jgi:hypothetical protein
LMTFTIKLGESNEVGITPYGNRAIGESAGGTFEGEKLRGTVRTPGSADWFSLSEDFVHLDVRATFETDDGAYIYVQYVGHVELTPGIQAAFRGERRSDYGEAYFFTTPRFETGDPRYRWLNNVICVGRGRLLQGYVEYEVFQVVN